MVSYSLPNRKPSNRLSFSDAVLVWKRLIEGELNSRIASEFDVNQGRISEIRTEKRFPGSKAVALEELGLQALPPHAHPYQRELF